jgi:hypothetical protein
MVTLAQLLELLYGARTRYASVRATLSVEIDHGLLERRDWPEDAFNPPPSRADRHSYRARLWLDAAGRIRLERRADGETDVEIADPGAGEDDVYEADSLAAELADLFDPAPLLGSVTFEILSDSTHAGRPAASVLARPRRQPIEIGSIWGCNAYELAIDLERGVLLRVVGRIGDESAGTIAVEEIAFDEPLAPELFEQEPQQDDASRAYEAPEPRRIETVSLRAAAKRAPFTLWVVRELLDEWRMYVRVAGEPPGAAPAWVEILYRSRDGGNRVELTEELASETFAYGWTSYLSTPPRPIEHRGEQVLVVAQEPYETQLALTRGETRIRISAFDSLEETLNLVEALAPVRFGEAAQNAAWAPDAR